MPLITGSPANELLTGTIGDDTILGLSGDDTLEGGAGNDVLEGGLGRDTFLYRSRFFGNDVIQEFSSEDFIDLSAWHVGDLETLRPYIFESVNGPQHSVIRILAGGITQSIELRNIPIAAIRTEMFLFNINPAGLNISAPAQPETAQSRVDDLFGGSGNDTITSNQYGHVLNGGGGNDVLIGNGGTDHYRGGAGNDVFDPGERGYDLDFVFDFSQGDKVDLRNYNIGDLDTLLHYVTDTTDGLFIKTYFQGRTEAIQLKNVRLADVSTNSFIFNTSNIGLTVRVSDEFPTDATDVFGGNGDDILLGGSGYEILNGGRGNDRLEGRGNIDDLRGGEGNDTFVFATRGFGQDVIFDFNVGDKIDLRGLNIGDFATASAFFATDTVRNLNGLVWTSYFESQREAFILQGVSLSSLTADSFVFNSSLVGLTIIGTANGSWLFGGNGNDTMTAGAGGDYLIGGAGEDTFSAGVGRDSFRGGAGNDVFKFGARGFNYDTIFDFSIGDKIDLRGTNISEFSAIVPYLFASSRGAYFRTYLNNIEEVIDLVGVPLANISADQFIFNNSTTSVILEASGTFRSDLFGGNGNDTLNGASASAVALNGGAGDDLLIGTGGRDTLRGGSGDDILEGKGDGDELVGGEGASDVASYRNAISAVTVSLFANAPASGEAGGDTYSGIEIIHGGEFNDSIAGDQMANSLLGFGGNDQLVGGDGNDTLLGGDGADSLVGGEGSDSLQGGNGIDTLLGGAGNDYLNGDLGANVFDGGDGFDKAFLDLSDTTTTVNFNSRLAASTGGQTFVNGTLVRNVEDVILSTGEANDNFSGFSEQGFYWSGGAGLDLFIGDFGAETRAIIAERGRFFYSFQVGGNTTGLSQSLANDVEYMAVQLGSGNDRVLGLIGNDTIAGGAGNDTLNGAVGNDVLEGGAGADALFGGDGNLDIASYSTSSSGVLVNLISPNLSTGDAAGDTFDGLEGYLGSKFADTIIGNVGDNTIIGGEGDDSLVGSGGSDFLLGGAGNDFIDGGDGGDTVSFADTVIGGVSVGVIVSLDSSVPAGGEALGDTFINIESVVGTRVSDQIYGSVSANTLFGIDGDDRLFGRDGNDFLDGGLGADVLDGGAGFDFASYANATTALTVYMGGGTFNSGEANGDIHTSIEGLIGGSFADILGGSGENNELRGLGGNDWIYGQAGNDTLQGGTGNDVLSGGAGGDRLEGGDDIDVAFYRDATVGLTASLLTGGTTGEASGDTYLNIENIWGSDFDDVLTGDNGGGQVYGFAGNDQLSGLDGDDFFYGSVGLDTMTGGNGVDNFFFLSWNDHFNQFGTLEAYEGGDTFTDFTVGTDRIILSRYWFGFGNIQGPAAALTDTHANFVTNGTAPASARPSLIWNAGIGTLSFDADGNGATQAVLLGTFQAGAALTLSDIWTA